MILYEENIFCFAAPRYCGNPDRFIENNGYIEWSHRIAFPPSEKGIVAFERIKHMSQIPVHFSVGSVSNVSTVQLDLSG